MKKGFGNRLFVVTAAAAASFLLLSGFDSTLTVEDVNEKTKEALSTMNGFSATVSGVADASIDVAADGETQSLAMKGELDYSVQITEEPFALAVSGSMAGDAAAMGVSGGLEMEMYLAQQEDGTGIVYVRVPQGEDTGWHAAALGAERECAVPEVFLAQCFHMLRQRRRGLKGRLAVLDEHEIRGAAHPFGVARGDQAFLA